jgi:hypothetical protein
VRIQADQKEETNFRIAQVIENHEAGEYLLILIKAKTVAKVFM